MTVIARLDRAIETLDSPVKPENDKQTKLCRHTNANDRINIMITYDQSEEQTRRTAAAQLYAIIIKDEQVL
jgi:hypothetical protein